MGEMSNTFHIPTAAFNYKTPSFILDYPMILFVGILGISYYPDFHGVLWLEVCLIRQCSFCHIHRKCYGHTMQSVADLFPAWFS
jgi:hypothetical protein